ncbi:hypothetical protein OSB04_003379 [Centaurea solstitialis]|uniref:Uncharacterized protein n=1 Tax=Centaurea solstitialis TaxID=347529 RepID=A0AA38UCG3_9ASTR|nr:hypothetical protein OSB04_003379 [Centaurea solstitialis]
MMMVVFQKEKEDDDGGFFKEDDDDGGFFKEDDDDGGFFKEDDDDGVHSSFKLGFLVKIGAFGFTSLEHHQSKGGMLLVTSQKVDRDVTSQKGQQRISGLSVDARYHRRDVYNLSTKMNIQCKDSLLKRYKDILETYQFYIDPKNQPHEKVSQEIRSTRNTQRTVECPENINGYIHPQRIVQHNESHLLDYNKVIDFNQEMWCLKTCLNLRVKKFTEDGITHTNISLFYIPTNILMN